MADGMDLCTSFESDKEGEVGFWNDHEEEEEEVVEVMLIHIEHSAELPGMEVAKCRIEV